MLQNTLSRLIPCSEADNHPNNLGIAIDVESASVGSIGTKAHTSVVPNSTSIAIPDY